MGYSPFQAIISDLHNIDKGTPFLLLYGNVSYNTNSTFKNTFKVYHNYGGCTGSDHKIMAAYNQTIFKYLDKTYDSKWHRQIRKDVVGFKKWQKDH